VDFQSSTDTGGFSHGFDPEPSQKMAQVETVVKQGLELQLCVLECLLLAGYDPQISRSELRELLRLPMILPAAFPSKVLWGKKHRNHQSSRPLKMPFQFGCLLVSTQKLLLQTFLPFQRQERSRADLPNCRGRDSLGDLGNLSLIQHNPPSPAKFAQECYRQRFLGSLPRAAHLHHWLLGDAEICPSAATRMVGGIRGMTHPR